MLIQRWSRAAAGFLATLLVASCNSENRGGSSSAVGESEPIMPAVRVDSGITIMEHAADALERAPQLMVDSIPLTVAGGAEGDPTYDLTYVSDVVPLSDGRLFTFSRIGNRVYLFGRDGRGERVFGRTGEGPGDWMNFGNPQRLAADTVLVIDFANQRLNWLTPDGGVTRTAPLTLSGAVMRLHGVAGILPNGDAILHGAGSWGGQQTDSLNRTMAPIVALSLTGSASRTVAMIPDLTGLDFETRYRGRKRTEWRPLRLGGWALVTVWDSVIATGGATEPGIDLRDGAGAVRARLVVRRPGRAVTGPMRTAQIERELARLSGPGSERMVDVEESRRQAREAPFADTLPRFSTLLSSSDGTLWAVDAIAPSDTTWSATAFRKDGAIVGRLHVRGPSRPMAFEEGRVVVRTEDENGVVALRVLALGYVSGEAWDSDRSRRLRVGNPP